MREYLLWIMLLAIWNIVLFFDNALGVSVVLFIVPLLGFMYYVLKKNKKINNKKGLLYMIPITLLSITYMLFDNELFSVLNVFAIPVLITFMYIYTVNPTYRIGNIIKNVFRLLLFPYKFVARLYRVTIIRLKEIFRMTDKSTRVLKMLLIVIPITVVIIALLSSADMIFGNIFSVFLDKLLDILRLEFFDNLLGRITMFIIVFFVIGCTVMYLTYDYNKEEDNKKSNNKNRDLLTIKSLTTVLNIIYIVFGYIQIKSLLLHSVSSGINYAEYARQGFFELMVVSIINITLILITRKYETKNNIKEYRYVKVMNVLMVFLTIIIIASSFIRMHMYEAAFGYTTLRLLVFVTLITEAILMIPTVMYIFNSKVNIVKSYMIITLCAYIACNFMNMDYLIARRNVNRYYSVKDIDIDYLMNYNADNVPVIIELYNKDIEEDLSLDINDYLYSLKYTYTGHENEIFGFNLSRNKAKKLLEKVELIRDYRDYSEVE